MTRVEDEMMGSCDECKFWVATRMPRQGACHRYAPQATGRDEGLLVPGQWPLTMESDWCGDFDPGTDEPGIEVAAP